MYLDVSVCSIISFRFADTQASSRLGWQAKRDMWIPS